MKAQRREVTLRTKARKARNLANLFEGVFIETNKTIFVEGVSPALSNSFAISVLIKIYLLGGMSSNVM